MKKKRNKSVRKALRHPNKYGAGAKKRKRLSAKNKRAAVMAEFSRGTLHAGGSGKIVTNPKQAVAIAYSEARRKGKKKRRKK